MICETSQKIPEMFGNHLLMTPGSTLQLHTNRDIFIKLCENIGIFIKNYKSTIPGSKKVVYKPFKKESEEKNSKF